MNDPFASDLPNMIGLERSGEVYVFLFDDHPATIAALPLVTQKMIDNPELSFNEHDDLLVSSEFAGLGVMKMKEQIGQVTRRRGVRN